jgi:hypothetical protein
MTASLNPKEGLRSRGRIPPKVRALLRKAAAQVLYGTTPQSLVIKMGGRNLKPKGISFSPTTGLDVVS